MIKINLKGSSGQNLQHSHCRQILSKVVFLLVVQSRTRDWARLTPRIKSMTLNNTTRDLAG